MNNIHPIKLSDKKNIKYEDKKSGLVLRDKRGSVQSYKPRLFRDIKIDREKRRSIELNRKIF